MLFDAEVVWRCLEPSLARPALLNRLTLQRVQRPLGYDQRALVGSQLCQQNVAIHELENRVVTAVGCSAIRGDVSQDGCRSGNVQLMAAINGCGNVIPVQRGRLPVISERVIIPSLLDGEACRLGGDVRHTPVPHEAVLAPGAVDLFAIGTLRKRSIIQGHRPLLTTHRIRQRHRKVSRHLHLVVQADKRLLDVERDLVRTVVLVVVVSERRLERLFAGMVLCNCHLERVVTTGIHRRIGRLELLEPIVANRQLNGVAAHSLPVSSNRDRDLNRLAIATLDRVDIRAQLVGVEVELVGTCQLRFLSIGRRSCAVVRDRLDDLEVAHRNLVDDGLDTRS